MATGMPTSPKVEFEATSGTWTDVSADVDWPTGVKIQYGRSGEFTTGQAATLSFTLDNTSGKYTPFNTSGTFYPNIQPRKRIRYSYVAGTQQMRFVGFIKQWQPQMENGFRPIMTVNASCAMDQLSRVVMLPPLTQEITIDKPFLWWPLTDAQGSTQALEQSGNGGPPLGIFGTGTAVVFGDNGPGVGDGPGVKFAAGQSLIAGIPTVNAAGFSGVVMLEAWVNTTSGNDHSIAGIEALGGGWAHSLKIMGTSLAGKAQFTGPGGLSINGPAIPCNDGGWHQIVIIQSGGTWTIYVDNTTGDVAAGFPPSGVVSLVRVGAGSGGTAPFTGNIGQVQFYSAGTLLGAGRMAAHSAAGHGYPGDTTDQRIARYLGYAGITSSGYNLDAGQVQVNTYPQAGKDALSGCQDMAVTEGGGAVFYTTPDGLSRFANRRFRDPRTPALTLDAVKDLDSSVYAPSFDELTMVNEVTVDRSSESGSQTSQTYSNTTAVAQYGTFIAQVTTYTLTDLDALALAQYDANSLAIPAVRFPQIAADLVTAENNLYAALATVQIGSRLRVTNFTTPIETAAASLDFFVEGWTETVTNGSYQVVFDVTAADIPGARFELDVSTLDGPDVLAL